MLSLSDASSLRVASNKASGFIYNGIAVVSSFPLPFQSTTMNKKNRILICDDEPTVLTTLRLLLESRGYEAVAVSTPEEALYTLEHQEVALLLMDMNYQRDTTSGAEGLSLIDSTRTLDNDLPIVVMTGWGTVELAVEAMQKGANDFIQKPWDNERLLTILHTQLQLGDSRLTAKKLETENHLLRSALNQQDNADIVANSPAMQALMKRLEMVAATDSNLLLTGENGVGKSLLARWVHQHSLRSEASFIEVNMGAISETLFESEFFGHVKGAFTDARENRIGRFELANGGTLFLDEIGNLPLSQQAKMLRVLESAEFEKVGSSRTQQTNVRVISATNADVAALAESEQFRKDLFYRLNTVQLTIPALRDRKEDIVPIAQKLCLQAQQKYGKKLNGIAQDAAERLKTWHWPGNIRELSHVIERGVIFCEGELITQQELMLPESDSVPTAPAPFSLPVASSDMLEMAEIEKQVLTQRLEAFAGNANEAAASLGLSRSAFYRRLDKYK